MKRLLPISLILMLIALFVLPVPVQAQDETPSTGLTISTTYPSQIIGFGEVVTMTLKLQADSPQMVTLEVAGLPEGWEASFRGGSRIVDAVYLDGENTVNVDVRIEPPETMEAGKYNMKVVARGRNQTAEMPITLTVKEKLPPRLTLDMDGLPVQRGTPSTTFRYTVTLKNEGGEDLTVALSADQPTNMQVRFESAGQTVTELQLAANESKNLTVVAEPLITLEAGRYDFRIYARAGDVEAAMDLAADVVGEGRLSITTPDGRLSGQATAGQNNPLKIILKNTGTAPLQGIELSSIEPTGWSVTFEPKEIVEIPAGQQVEVTATIKPAEKAVAGDYLLTIKARPVESKEQSAEFRITVVTSTLWGVAGIALIAVAVAAVGMAVSRFGRR
ncbi:MAG: NEW3 domain-containing protein [Chloroflexota bacterium]